MHRHHTLFLLLLVAPACPADDGSAGDTTGDTSTGSASTMPSTSSTSGSTSTSSDPTASEDSTSSGTAAESSTGTPGTDGESSGGSTTTGSGALEIIGEYDDDFGGHHEISMETWIYDSGDFGVYTTNLMSFDNDEDWVAGEDADNPGTFLRFDWTYDDRGTLWYCNAVFDATSLQDAIDAPPSDASDPATGGCGGAFPWTMLTEA